MFRMKKFFAPFVLFLAALIWGIAFSAQKSLAAVLPPFTVGAIRSIIAFFFLLAVIPVFDRARGNGRRLFSLRHAPDFTRVECLGGCVCGVALAIASVLQQTGIATTDTGKASFITALYVAIVPICVLFLGKRSPLHVWAGVVVAVIGFFVLCVSEDFSVAPSDLVILAGTLFFSIQIISIDHFAPRCDPLRLSCMQFLSGAIVNTVIAAIREWPIDPALLLDNLLPLLYLGICSSGIAYTLQMIGQKRTHPAIASLILSLESVFGLLSGLLFAHETHTPREYLGCAIMFLAILLAEVDFVAPLRRLLRRELTAPADEDAGEEETGHS